MAFAEYMNRDKFMRQPTDIVKDWFYSNPTLAREIGKHVDFNIGKGAPYMELIAQFIKLREIFDDYITQSEDNAMLKALLNWAFDNVDWLSIYYEIKTFHY